MMGQDFVNYLREQALRHPSMMPQDAVKLCFQVAFGVEHLLTERNAAMGYLQKEYSQTPAQDMAVFEPISDEYVRCNLAAWKSRELPLEWLFEMFWQSADLEEDAGLEGKSKCSEALFMKYLDSVGRCVEEGLLPFDKLAWLSFKERYLSLGGGEPQPVHHSEEYRNQECPAYRVIKKKYSLVFPVLEKASALLGALRASKTEAEAKGQGQGQGQAQAQAQAPIIIAIDGRAAAGKSTMATILSAVLKADLIHMDDFFLPLELRTAERFAEAGGNVHYERFCLEVLPFLKNRAGFSYRTFDCSIMDYGKSRFVQSEAWRIVEGSYSCHPKFGDYADLRVFCDITPEKQMQRIKKRNGDAMARVFKEKWIPLEEQYLVSAQIKEKADIIMAD